MIESLALTQFKIFVHFDRFKRTNLDANLAAHADRNVDVEHRRIKLRFADVIRLLVLALSNIDALRRAFLFANLTGNAAQAGVGIVSIKNQEREISIILRQRTALFRILHRNQAILFEITSGKIPERYRHSLENPSADHCGLISLKRRHIHKEKLITVHRIGLILWFAVAVTAQAGDFGFESGPQKTHLIELFTSQGCSSCPPAEAWLSKLKAEPRLWKDFVPIAFHVDYWDRLGWRDPFASKEWTDRQYQYSAAWKSESVYTPGFVLDGREWMGRRVPTASIEKGGALKLSIANGKALVKFDGASKDADLHVALLGFDLTTKVGAGENSGRNLRQDFVVLSLANQKMTDGKTEMPLKFDSRAGAVAAWITAPNQLEPIQALGGWLK